jgi:hypothetical protein
MTPAQEQMALDAVAGALDQHLGPYALGAARSRIHSRARAARVFRFVVYATFGVATTIPLIILAHLIDWTGVAESVGLY